MTPRLPSSTAPGVAARILTSEKLIEIDFAESR
jgi:hypothetical protein